MGRKALPYLKVGQIILPRPPVKATHIKLNTAKGQHATVAIRDVDTLRGVEGKIYFIRRHGKTQRVIEEYKDKVYKWNGEGVEGI
jgi:hypothetical protein